MSPEAIEVGAPAAPVLASAAAPAPPTPAAKVGPAAQPSPSDPERLLTSRGGTVVARCHRGGGVYLVYWTPAQGYRAEDVIRGPAAMARLVFEGREHHYRILVACVDSVPRASIRDIGTRTRTGGRLTASVEERRRDRPVERSLTSSS